MRHGAGGVTPRSTRQRWGAFLLQRGATTLTTAQKRSLRRRSTHEQLLDLTPAERLRIGVIL